MRGLRFLIALIATSSAFATVVDFEDLEKTLGGRATAIIGSPYMGILFANWYVWGSHSQGVKAHSGVARAVPLYPYTSKFTFVAPSVLKGFWIAGPDFIDDQFCIPQQTPFGYFEGCPPMAIKISVLLNGKQLGVTTVQLSADGQPVFFANPYTGAVNEVQFEESGHYCDSNSTFGDSGHCRYAIDDIDYTPAPLCQYTLAPPNVTFTPIGGMGIVSVNASSNDQSCTWNATSNAPWITITGANSGTGSGTVTYTVAPNVDPAISMRTGTLSIAGQTFTVTQGAMCTFSLSAPGHLFQGTAASDTVAVIASAPTCQWTASTSNDWITITGGSSGTGNGSVSYKVTANIAGPSSVPMPRNGMLTIAGQPFNIIQNLLTFNTDPQFRGDIGTLLHYAGAGWDAGPINIYFDNDLIATVNGPDFCQNGSCAAYKIRKLSPYQSRPCSSVMRAVQGNTEVDVPVRGTVAALVAGSDLGPGDSSILVDGTNPKAGDFVCVGQFSDSLFNLCHAAGCPVSPHSMLTLSPSTPSGVLDIVDFETDIKLYGLATHDRTTLFLGLSGNRLLPLSAVGVTPGPTGYSPFVVSGPVDLATDKLVAILANGDVYLCGTGTYSAGPCAKTPNMPGDVNGDANVDCADIAIIKASFGRKRGEPGFDTRADVNGDGVVDVKDLALVSQRLPFRTKCP